MIIKRFPRSDSDGDGTLSEKELEKVIKIATARAKNQGGRKSRERKRLRQKTNATHSCKREIWRPRAERFRYLVDRKFQANTLGHLYSWRRLSGRQQGKAKSGCFEATSQGRHFRGLDQLSLREPDAPLPSSHHDARRALQFMRSKAKEWNLDKSRVAAFGGSAALKSACGWPIPTTWQNPRARIPLSGSPPG